MAVFIPKFEAFLNKCLSLKSVPNKAEVLNNWNEQRDLQLDTEGTVDFIQIMFEQFKHTLLQRFKNYNYY